MNVTRGNQPIERPPGTLRAIHFPQLALMDEGTNEGWLSRVLHADGGDVQELPRSIFGQWVDAPGHDGAVPVGTLHEVSFDFEQNPKMLSGKGWLADTMEGKRQALAILNGSLRHNSVDLSEVEVELEEVGNFWDDDFKLIAHFVRWKLARTTLVSTPAFADAHATLTDDEVTAALSEIMASSDWDPMEPFVITVPSIVAFDVKRPHIEVTASAAPKPSWDYFYVPEPDEELNTVVEDCDANGFYPVYGHLGSWDSCHDGVLGSCLMIPRPDDNYASWNKRTVIADAGTVYTGPLCLYGGHHPLAEVGNEKAMAKAYLQLADGIDNVWADVRMTVGRIGPWFSGYVRPGLAEVDVVAARGSSVSGHWINGKLKFVVSVAQPGFDMAGPDLEVAASMASFRLDDEGEVVELFASLPACSTPKPDGAVAPSERFVVQDLGGGVTATFTNVDPIATARTVVAAITDLNSDTSGKPWPEQTEHEAEVALAELELDEDDELYVG